MGTSVYELVKLRRCVSLINYVYSSSRYHPSLSPLLIPRSLLYRVVLPLHSPIFNSIFLEAYYYVSAECNFKIKTPSKTFSTFSSPCHISWQYKSSSRDRRKGCRSTEFLCTISSRNFLHNGITNFRFPFFIEAFPFLAHPHKLRFLDSETCSYSSVFSCHLRSCFYVTAITR